MIKKQGRCYYNLAELSKVTGIPHVTIRNWCENGRLKAQKEGRLWVVLEENAVNFFTGKGGDQNASC